MILRTWAAWVAVAGILIVSLVGLDRQATAHWPATHTLERTISTPSAALSILSFGLRPLMADYLWIDAVQYLGHTLGHHEHDIVDGSIVERGLSGDDTRTASEVFYSLVKRTVEVDPLFVRPAMLGALFLIDPHANPMAGLRLLESGARSRPDSWQLRLWHGFYRYAILRDRQTALDELAAAARCPGRPDYVPQMRHFLETAPDSSLAKVFFRHALHEARTETERARLQQRLDELDAGLGEFGIRHDHHDDHHGHGRPSETD
ncbi:hypothetical protein JXA88_15565 [Candidatus Fermentibacteria bacterium]|nr:hypothetical protein [Candidatus Fermentibacteria bacterium]